MAITTGRVINIAIRPQVGKFTLIDSGGTPEEFLLWASEPEDVTDRIIHSMYLSILRTSVDNNLEISVGHPDDGPTVQSLILRAATP